MFRLSVDIIRCPKISTIHYLPSKEKRVHGSISQYLVVILYVKMCPAKWRFGGQTFLDTGVERRCHASYYYCIHRYIVIILIIFLQWFISNPKYKNHDS